MAVALESIVKQLEDSGIVAAGKLKEFIPPKAAPKDGETLLRELYKQNLLTKFQAQHFAQGRAKALILGNYTILDKIGAGGMGQVFKAQHRRMERIVAIKMLPSNVTKDAAMVARFQREVVAAAKLRHPNIVAADDSDEANGVHFLVMEYVEGKDLSALVKANGPFSAQKAISYILQVARGLEFAHGEGVVHRDIKPANLLLDKKGTVKILDMGLARIESGGDAAAQAELTGTGAVMGTVDYMAPEQGLSTKHADARADIYSLGCSLHYLLTGKPMFDGETITAKLLAHHHQPIPDLCQLKEGVPEQVQIIFSKMVAKAINDRYQTMSEVIADLEQCGGDQQTSLIVQQSIGTNLDNSAMTFLRDLPAHTTIKPNAAKKAAKPASAGGSRNKTPSHNRAMWIGAGAMGCLSLVLGVIVIIRNQKGDEIQRIELPAGQTAEIQEVATKPVIIPPVVSKEELGKRITAFGQPAFQAWMKEVVAMPAEKQVAAVSKKMVELNPGFDGQMLGRGGWAPGGVPKIENGVVTEIGAPANNLTDVSPIRALVGLKALSFNRAAGPQPMLSDLSPLQGMSLTYLGCRNVSKVADLSPLQGMPLTSLDIYGTQVSDLSPLRGTPLTYLDCYGAPIYDFSPLQNTKVTNLMFGGTKIADLSALRGLLLTNLAFISVPISDLTPLKGMPLTSLTCFATKVSDLSPLKGMRLTSLNCAGTPASDLSPLDGMPLTYIDCNNTKVSDFAPLKGMPLTSLVCNGAKISDLSALKGMKLTNLNCSSTKVSDISPLEDCKSLTAVIVSKTNVTPAGVAALQKALPKCKIEWDDPAKPKTPEPAASLKK